MEDKNWTGNSKSVHTVLGASNHSSGVRAHLDYYATDPRATEMLMELEEINNNVLDPAVGGGHLVKPLIKGGYNVNGIDIVDRGHPNTIKANFLESDKRFEGDIVVNPPYKYAKEFIEKSLETVGYGNKVFAFLKIQFLESKGRREFFKENPPKRVWVSSSRIVCAKNGDFSDVKSSAVCYCWYVWEKGYKGSTELGWFN